MFAGTKGSGKSTLYEQPRKDSVIHTEIYVAADRIESEFRKKHRLVFNAYRLKVAEDEFISSAKRSSILMRHKSRTRILKSLRIKSGVLTIVNPSLFDSYAVSFVATYVADKLLESGQSFCFETVMSHASKIALLSAAKRSGFKTYLYFIFTDDPEINIQRVALRKKAGGHGVATAKIKSRYSRSLNALPAAARIADESYLVDNSGTIENAYEVVAELKVGKVKARVAGYDFESKLPAFYKAFKRELR